MGGADDEEVLGIRVAGVELRADDAALDEPVDRVAAAAADADDLDVRPQAREDALELGILRPRADDRGRRLGDPWLLRRSGDDFPNNGVHDSASGYAKRGSKQP